MNLQEAVSRSQSDILIFNLDFYIYICNKISNMCNPNTNNIKK